MSSNSSYDERVKTVSFRCSSDLKSELDNLVEELDMTKREWLEAQIEETKLDYAEAVNQGREIQAEQLQEKLKAKDETIEQLRESISANTDRIHGLLEERNSLESEIDTLRERLVEKESKIATLEDLYEIKSQELEETQEELASRQREIESLRSVLVEDIGHVARTVGAVEESLLENLEEVFHEGRVVGMTQLATDEE